MVTICLFLFPTSIEAPLHHSWNTLLHWMTFLLVSSCSSPFHCYSSPCSSLNIPCFELSHTLSSIYISSHCLLVPRNVYCTVLLWLKIVCIYIVYMFFLSLHMFVSSDWILPLWVCVYMILHAFFIVR